MPTVTVLEHVVIPVRDGTRLAARIWLPDDAEREPVPAILEYLPYRKNDGTAVGDHAQMSYFAHCGYAGVRVDIRGSGDSDGILDDEYGRAEQLDGVDVIAWLAEQPWCSGSVGMTGGSWGGFNALQIAAHAPPALHAVMTYYASDDRYADDVHYRGGCVLAMDMLQWAGCMMAYNAKPPDPAYVGDGWRAAWLDRLERTPAFIAEWLAHQRRDAYWENGSVCDDYTRIRCPVYAIGGWTDGYTDAVLRLLEHLDVPRKGLIGPWGHRDPEAGVPGPSVGMLRESVRWWDRWLKGIDNGIDGEPALVAYVQDWMQPSARIDVRPGRFVAEPSWPSATVAPRGIGLGGSGDRRSLRGLQGCGLDAGAWCADGRSDDLPPDQRGDDGMSLCYDSEPLPADVEILGLGRATVRLAADAPQANLFARVCEVAPDGVSLLVVRGYLNLAHRTSHAAPAALEPGVSYDVEVPLDAIGHRFSRGNRIRLALSPTSWPLIWPAPTDVTLTVSNVALELPVRAPRDDDGSAFLGAPEGGPELETVTLAPDPGGRRIVRDLARDTIALEFDWDNGGLFRIVSSGLESADTCRTVYRIRDRDPLSAEVASDNGMRIGRGAWQTRADVRSRMTCDAERFVVEQELVAYEGDAEVFRRRQAFTFPRDHV